MIGGEVEAVIPLGKKLWRLVVVDHGDMCCTNICDGRVRVGDSVWWQGRKVLWTPRDKHAQGVQLPRAGHSYDPFRSQTDDR